MSEKQDGLRTQPEGNRASLLGGVLVSVLASKAIHDDENVLAALSNQVATGHVEPLSTYVKHGQDR